MALPEFPIDGNWVDIGSLGTGLIYTIYSIIKNRDHTKLFSKQTGFSFANGIALFPLLIMTFSVMSSALIKGLVEASKISLSAAGFFALLAILEEDDDDSMFN